MQEQHLPLLAGDPELEARIDTMLARMTLEEKVGQMNQRGPQRNADLETEIRTGRLGSLLSIRSTGEINRLQRIAVEESRLGIHGLDNRYIVEPGGYAVWIGPSSAEGLEGRFRVL